MGTSGLKYWRLVPTTLKVECQLTTEPNSPLEFCTGAFQLFLPKRWRHGLRRL